MIKSKKIFHCTVCCLFTASYKKASVSLLKLKHVMDPVVCAVNSIRASGLKHRKFRIFLENIEADFTDVLYQPSLRYSGRRGGPRKFAWAHVKFPWSRLFSALYLGGSPEEKKMIPYDHSEGL